MPLEYEQNERLKAIAPILDDVIHWYGTLALYMVEAAEPVQPRVQSFAYWIREAFEDPGFADFNLQDLEEQYETVMELAQALVNGDVEDCPRHFQKITDAYFELCSLLRWAELYSVSSDLGLDELTGLRNKNRLIKDYGREMERVARDGENFVILLASIDFFDLLLEVRGKSIANEFLIRVAEMVKEVIRSFDDAYYMGDGEYMIILRQSDLGGSLAVSNRLQEAAREDGSLIIEDENPVKLSVSSTIADPMPGDDLDAILDRMRAYLRESRDEASSIHEYRDMSPLELYVKSQEN